ncbi:hypothetical protein Tco_0968649 [Tanacetum coccineum]
MTSAQQNEYMSTYIKNQEGGYTLKQLKALSFEEVKKIFEATMRKDWKASRSVQEQTGIEPKAEELSQEQLHQMMMVIPVEEVYVEALQWLYDTCGVYLVSTERGHDIYMLVEKDYPLTKALMTLMLCNKLRVDQYSDMAEELLKKIFILVERPRNFNSSVSEDEFGTLVPYSLEHMHRHVRHRLGGYQTGYNIPSPFVTVIVVMVAVLVPGVVPDLYKLYQLLHQFHELRSMIGSLMYLTTSRPDIMFAVCACARFQVTPKTSHLLAVKRIFRYLKGKPTLGLWYSRDSPFELVVYTDSDYAGATLDRNTLDSKSIVRLWIFLQKVSDEAVYKELGDRMERAATAASSLEAEQDSGNINKTQSIATLNESSP